MEFYQLRSFVVVAEEQSITKAAKRLYTTPPSVSAHIKALEEELGISLFERLPTGMQLTPKGCILKDKALATLNAAQEVVNYATEIQSHLIGTIKLGINAPATFLRISELVSHISEYHPGIELSLVHSSSGQILQGLLDRTLDMGYLYGPVTSDQLTTHFLCATNLVVAAPAKWQEQLQNMTWADLGTLPWIDTVQKDCPFQHSLDKIFTTRGISYKRAASSSDEKTRRELVEAEAGLSLLLEDEAKEAGSDKIFIVQTEPISCELFVAYASANAGNPLNKCVLDTILQHRP